jgi:hypothetical protein
MSAAFKKVEEEARALRPEEKAELAHILIGDLDDSHDPDVERLWQEEAWRRYEAFQRGESKAVSGEEAIKRARARIE